MTTPRTIAIVGDDNGSARLREAFLPDDNQGNFKIYQAHCLREAIGLLREQSIDVIVLDLALSDRSGLSAVKDLRIASPTSAIVVLTENGDEDDFRQAIEYGAQNCIAKQDRTPHGMAKVIRQAYIRQQHQLKVAAEAHTDPLTGVANRRALDTELRRRAADFTRHAQPFSLLMFDIDFFQKINDEHGHQVGDTALINLAKILQQQVRCTDLVARYGGEEFAVVASMTELDEAFELATRIRHEIESAFEASDAGCPPLTVSGGAAQFRSSDNIASLIRHADAALYQAKQRGRNQCMANIGSWYASDLDENPFEFHGQPTLMNQLTGW